jgi:hypothetical protein
MELDMRHSKAGWSVTPPSVRDKKIRRHAGDIRRLLARNREYVMEEAPLPQVARPVMYHHWSPITFLHRRYPSAVMQFLLSPELTAERSGGAAWVRLASFSWRSGCGGARRSVAVEVRGSTFAPTCATAARACLAGYSGYRCAARLSGS